VMLEQARRGILLVDHSKFDQARYEIICALAELDDLVSDDPPPRALAEALAEANVALHLAAPERFAADRVPSIGF
jgi:DeoR/GlpR family transcriptional regulator of sugar metabolism